MGTRCLTVMYETPSEGGNEIAVLYRQFDGYPEGHGEELSEFLKDMVVVNGISLDENRKIANGSGCLAAQIVAHFKEEPGGFYLHKAGTRDCWEEYIYHVRPQDDGTIKVDVEEV
jgi:hypothetical protein